MPPADLKCPEKTPIGAGIGSVARAGKTSQQRFEYFRSMSTTRPEVWAARGGIPVYAANVTPNQGQPRIWCVAHTISPKDFDKLSEFLLLLERVDWTALSNLLKDAENLARQEWVLTQINNAVGPLKEEITAIRTAIALLMKRVEVLEKDMKEVKADVADLKRRRLSIDLGVKGYFTPPMLSGTNMAYEFLGEFALNIVFGENGDWIFRPSASVGAGNNNRVWGVGMVFEAAFLKSLNSGSIQLGPVLRGSTNILLNGPTGSYASDSNAGGGPMARFYMGKSKRVFGHISGTVGAKIQNCPRGGYCANLGGDVAAGIGFTLR